MPDKKDNTKKEEFFIRTDRFIYTKDDLKHIIGLDEEKKSTILLKKMLPGKKKMK
jgi:hypothetical protein